MKECLSKSSLDVRQARRMVQDRSEWRGLVRGNAWGVAWGMNPTLKRYHNYMKPLTGGSRSVVEPTT